MSSAKTTVDPRRHGNAERMYMPTAKVLRGVRRFAREAIGEAPDPSFLAEVDVVVSELATNAIVHARTPFRVSISSTPKSVKIAVRDASFDPPRDRRHQADRGGGRGVGLVATFAKAWGTEPEPDGKTVWAELAAPLTRRRSYDARRSVIAAVAPSSQRRIH
jgi:anti-sigma regulatory factor (Ser/Thr protein kinase)